MSGALGKVLTGKTIAGKLRIGERLSGDPAGSIYLAVDLSTNQNVLVLALAEGVRLGGEQQAAALSHPNVLAHRFSYFPNAAQRFVATDAPSGRSLAQLIAKRGPMHPGPATNVALQILSALHAIHAEGTFHGNLNPHNVFVDKTEKGELEVRLLFPGSVRTESLPESLRYLAPEQILGEAVDRHADIWAVGALMYLCLFGRPPFDGADQEAISGKILLKDPVFPPEAEKLPADLVSAVRAALAKEPDKRPQFANSVIGDLLATAEEFDDQMPALVAAALRRSIPPAPFTTAPKPAPKPGGQAAPRPAGATLYGPQAAPRPAAAAAPKSAAQAAPKPAQATPKPVAATAPTILSQAAPRPAAAAPAPAPAAPKPVAATAAPTILSQAAPRPVPAAAAPLSADALAAEAKEISTALEDALEIDFRESIPPIPAPGSRPDGVPFLRDKRKLAIAVACAAVAVIAIAAVALVAGREEERAPAEAVAPVAEPREPAEPAPVVAAPVAPAAQPAPPAAQPAPPTAQPAPPTAQPAPPVEAKHTKKPGGAYQPPAAKKPQPSQEKKKPAPPMGAEGLASNPFGE